MLRPEVAAEHRDRLYRVARSLCGNREMAEDLVQETYALVLARPRRLRDGDELGYLLRALRNTFVETHRRAKRRPIEIGDHHAFLNRADRSADPERQLEAQTVRELVRELRSPFREAVISVDVAGLGYRDAAQALGVREGTLMSRLHRGRRSLREALSD